MGTGIAQVASSHGCIVTLIDSSTEAIDRSKSYLNSVLNRLLEKEKISQQDGEEKIADQDGQ